LHRWLRSLQLKNQEPAIKLLEVALGTRTLAEQLETDWIQSYEKKGYLLLNTYKILTSACGQSTNQESGKPKFHIYELRDPRGSLKRFIDRTCQEPRVRLNAHLNEARTQVLRKTPKARWLRELLDAEIRPEITILQAVDGTQEDADRYQQAWIAYYEALGYDLVNPQGPGCTLWPLTWIQAEDRSPEECLVKLDTMAQYRFKLLAEKLEVGRATIITSALSEFLDKQAPTTEAMDEFCSKLALSLKKQVKKND